MTREKKRIQLKKSILAALFLALGVVLPFLTAQLKEIGDTLLPMHLPVMLCGLVCGYPYGLAVGFILPLFRSLLFGMPPLYPSAVWMAFELATYGLVIGLLYRKMRGHQAMRFYVSLITAMVAGRIVWGIVKTVLLGLGGSSFTFAAFLTGGFIDAFPGIVLQLLLVPPLANLLMWQLKMK